VFRMFFAQPGKKLRPSLVLLSAFALREDNLRNPEDARLRESLIAIATVTELVHSASLMHDDVLDGSDLRRGHPTLNVQFGTKVAILAGDILYSHAFELILSHADNDIILSMAQCVRKMCRGEILNLSRHDFATYADIVSDKTATLMHLCCKAGAKRVQQAGDPEGVILALEAFGQHYGMTYQLADDLCDGDNDVANENRSAAISLLGRHVDGARAALTQIPDSIFKAGLAALLGDVVSKSTPWIQSAVSRSVDDARSAGHSV
jgi:geranylgeranyl pyrophosphate synthase